MLGKALTLALVFVVVGFLLMLVGITLLVAGMTWGIHLLVTGGIALFGGLVIVFVVAIVLEFAGLGHSTNAATVAEFGPHAERLSGYHQVHADGDHLYVGDVISRPIAWWQIREITSEDDDSWLVRWDGGTFELSQHDPSSRRVRKAILGVLAARENGCIIPGQPFAEDIPDTALSRARMVDASDERGLSRVDVEADD